MSDKIKIGVKLRPLIEREEISSLSIQWAVKNNTIFQIESDGKQRGDCFSFDHVFDSGIKNDEVFNIIARPIVASSVGGINGTIFAYGQTSSGKTYTMMGSRYELGIIPLSIQYLFEAINAVDGREFLLRASYIEIYNEKVNDLLQKGKSGLKLREIADGSVVICDLNEEVVHTNSQIMNLMKRGEKIRRIGETNMNERSSRSHTIFRIIIESRSPNEGENGAVQVSQLNLVDLAGSERLDQTGSKGDRLKEGCSINRSLFMLSHVISQLSEGQDQYVNFRDSKLTRILQSSLGGNALTAIICAVTPTAIEETASTLSFASRATNVKNKPHVNEVLSDAALLKRYARQIAKLQVELEKTKNKNRNDEVEEIESKLQEQQRHNELLQERIDLLKEKLIGSAAADPALLDKKISLRRRTWCGRSTRQSMFQASSSLQTIDEELVNTQNLRPEYLSSSMQDLTNGMLFETPLEEFELQLIDAEKRCSIDSIDTPEVYCNITHRKGRHVTFVDQTDCTESNNKELLEVGSQTDTFPLNVLLAHGHEITGTPPSRLRERIAYHLKEYEELQEFTRLEKQIYNRDSYEEFNRVEMENRHLQKSLRDLEAMILEVNCANSKLQDENKSLKEELNKELEKCGGLTNSLLSFRDVESSLSDRSNEISILKKQLKLAKQQIKNLENEKSDFEMTRELAEINLKKRNEELTCSLEDAWLKLQEFQCNDKSLFKEDAHNSFVELRVKDDCIVQLKQDIEEVKMNDQTEELKSIKEQLKSLEQSNIFYMEMLNEKTKSLDILKQEIGELNYVKEANLKFTEELKEKNAYIEHLEQQKNLKEVLNEEHRLKETGSATSTTDQSMKEEINLLKEKKLACIEKLNWNDNLFRTSGQQMQELNSVRERNLKYSDGLVKESGFTEKPKYLNEMECFETSTYELHCLKEEMKSLKEQNLIIKEQMKEKDSYLVSLELQIVELNSIKEANLKYIDELVDKSCFSEQLKPLNDVKDIGSGTSDLNCMEKEIESLKEDNILYCEELNPISERDLKVANELKEIIAYVEYINQENELKDTNLVSYTNNLSTMEEEVKIYEEQSLTCTEQLRDKNPFVEKLEEKVKEYTFVKEADLKHIDEIRETTLCVEEMKVLNEVKVVDSSSSQLSNMQKEMELLKQQNLAFTEQLKEKENDIETLEQQLVELNSVKKVNLENSSDELKEKHSCVECLRREKELNEICTSTTDQNNALEEMQFLKEQNLLYIKELKERDNCVEILKNQIEELNTKFIDELKLQNVCDREINEEKEVEVDLRRMQEEMKLLKQQNLMFTEQLKEEENYVETLEQQIVELNSVKKVNVENSSDEMKEKHTCVECLWREKELNEICTSTTDQNNALEEMQFLKEQNLLYIEELKERGNCVEILKNQIEELNTKFIDELKLQNICDREMNEENEPKEIESDLRRMQEEVKSLKQQNLVFTEQLKDRENYVETLEQQIEELNSVKKVNVENSSDEMKEKHTCVECLQQERELNEIGTCTADLNNTLEEMQFLKEQNLIYIEELKERDNCVEILKNQIEELNANFIDELKVQNIHDREMNEEKELKEIEADLRRMQEEVKSLKQQNLVFTEQLKDRENYVGTLEQQIEELNSVKKVNVENSSDEIKGKHTCVECLQQERELNEIGTCTADLNNTLEEMQFLKEQNLLYIEELKEKDNCVEILKNQIEELNANFIDVLKVQNTRDREMNEEKELKDIEVDLRRMQEEMKSLKQQNLAFTEQLKDRENYVETLEQQIEELNSVKKVNVENSSDEMKEKHTCVQCLQQERELNEIGTCTADLINTLEEMQFLKEQNLLYIEELKEKDNCVEILKNQIEELNANFIDELKVQNIRDREMKEEKELKDIEVDLRRMQEEMKSLKQQNLAFTEQLKEKENYVETLEQQIVELNSVKKVNVENNCDELKEKHACIECLQQGRKLDEVSTSTTDLNNASEEVQFLKDQNLLYIEELREKDNCVEILKNQIEELNAKFIDKLKCNREINEENELKEIEVDLRRMQEEMKALKEQNIKYIEQMKEKDNYPEVIKQEVEDLTSEGHASSKSVDSIKHNDACAEEVEQEMDPSVTELNKTSDTIDCLMNNDSYVHLMNVMQEELNSLKAENMMYIKQLQEKDNHLEVIENLKYGVETENEGYLKLVNENVYVDCKDELKAARDAKFDKVLMGEDENSTFLEVDELKSLKNHNFMYMKQLKEKNNEIELLKNQIVHLHEQNAKYLYLLNVERTLVQEIKDEFENLGMNDCDIVENSTDNVQDVQEGGIVNLSSFSDGCPEMEDSVNKSIAMYFTVHGQSRLKLETTEQESSMNLCSVAGNSLFSKSQETGCSPVSYRDKIEVESLTIQEMNQIIEVNELDDETLSLKNSADSFPKSENITEGSEEKKCGIKIINDEIVQLQLMTEFKNVLADSENKVFCLSSEVTKLKEENSSLLEFQKVKSEEIVQLSVNLSELSERNNLLMKSLEEVTDLRENNINFSNIAAVKSRELEESKIEIEILKEQIQNNDKLIKNLEEKCQESEVLIDQEKSYNIQISTDLANANKKLSDNSHQIDSCKVAMLKEIKGLGPKCDVESLRLHQLSELVKTFLTCVMEKEEEIFKAIQEQMDELRTQGDEALREHVNRDKKRDRWIKELEKEVERLEAERTKMEEKNKALEMDAKSQCLKMLEQEKVVLVNKVRQYEADMAIIQLELNHLKETVEFKNKALDALQITVEQKDAALSQLEEELESKLIKQKKLEMMLNEEMKTCASYKDMMQTMEKESSSLKENNYFLIEKLEKIHKEENEFDFRLNAETQKYLETKEQLDTLLVHVEHISEKNSVFSKDKTMLTEKIEELEQTCSLRKNRIDDLLTQLQYLETRHKEKVNEMNSLILKEKQNCSELTMNLKKTVVELDNLRAKMLAIETEKQQLQDELTSAQNQLLLQKNLRCTFEGEIEQLQIELAKVKEEALITNDKLLSLERLEEENASLTKKMKQAKSDTVLAQQEAIHLKEFMEKQNIEAAKKLNDVQLLVNQKDATISQLYEDLKQQSCKQYNLDRLLDELMKKSTSQEQALLQEISHLKDRLIQESEKYFITKQKLDEMENVNLRTQNNVTLLDDKLSLSMEDKHKQALLKEKMRTRELITKLNSLEMELKLLSVEKRKLEAAAIVSKEIYSLLSNEKQQCIELSSSLKKVREDLKTLELKKLVWDSEKQQLQEELRWERNLRCKFEKEASGIIYLKQERDQALKNYDKVANEIAHLHESIPEHNLSNPKYDSQKSDPNVREQLEESLQKQTIFAKKNENMSIHITNIMTELEKSCTENEDLRVSLKKLVAEIESAKTSQRAKDRELQDLKLQLKKCTEEKQSLDDENELMLKRIRCLDNTVKTLCNDNDDLEKNIATLEEEKSKVISQLSERTNGQKSSVATATDISGNCNCVELSEKVQELKISHAERNIKIGTLELQIKTEEFPYKQRVKEMEDNVSFFKGKNIELKAELRRLQHQIKDSSRSCEYCIRRNSLKLKCVAVQTDEVSEVEELSLAAGGGSGIIREDMMIKMRIKIHDLQRRNDLLKNLCRERRRKILELEGKLLGEALPYVKEEQDSYSRESQGAKSKQRYSPYSFTEVNVGKCSEVVSRHVRPDSVYSRGEPGNKENSHDGVKSTDRPGRNSSSIHYKYNLRRPLNENISGVEESDKSP